MKNEQLIELTATGIVTELHRASLLIPIQSGTVYQTNVADRFIFNKRSYQNAVYKIKKAAINAALLNKVE